MSTHQQAKIYIVRSHSRNGKQLFNKLQRVTIELYAGLERETNRKKYSKKSKTPKRSNFKPYPGGGLHEPYSISILTLLYNTR